ncbi:hypothetical protein SAMN03159489_02750 [Pseudomonas sp. NFPP07]|nr:hypothetical protein SAMN03159489_02750 [Pseudomonas sp. NFPP07]
MQPGFTTATPPIAGCASGYIGPITAGAGICSSTYRIEPPIAAKQPRLWRFYGGSSITGTYPCSRWRSLRSTAQQTQTQATRCARDNVQPGFTTATPPIAGCASGYIGPITTGAGICSSTYRIEPPIAAKQPQLAPRLWRFYGGSSITGTYPRSRWRSLRSAAQQTQTQATRCARDNVQPGFTTATPPSAGCASGYIGPITAGAGICSSAYRIEQPIAAKQPHLAPRLWRFYGGSSITGTYPRSRWRSLRSAAQQTQTQATRCARNNVQPGFTTATPPSTGCASGYIGPITAGAGICSSVYRIEPPIAAKQPQLAPQPWCFCAGNVR